MTQPRNLPFAGAIFLLASCLSAAAETAVTEPTFADYPATEALAQEAVHPDYTGEALMYRTMIREGIEEGPNAGGRYTIIPIGCGVACTVVEMVDLRDGRLVDFPLGGEVYYQLGLDYRVDSRLIVANWKDASEGEFDRCVRQFYEIAGGEVDLIEEIRFTLDEPGICSEARAP